ncbi:hypothetical protein [Comamonas endophytica]|uniref:Uncharacterized protein n=1 Tax=Comamonas endophytica TaxID=2949090 RepID=A0ABY6G929_9BURK|nr:MULTISPECIES: hypothetical protein [unclassified Acidovorax]MCD2511829.1 hypothetical protein [Acidovorax sp. D4N7]UYG51552.1 hypothetical protein M9799_16100 [Acidovorax sp. 5MLIR]
MNVPSLPIRPAPVSRWLGLMLTLSMSSLPLATHAQPAVGISFSGQPTSFLVQSEPYAVQGFGRARLGMSMDEVKASIAADYPQVISTREDDNAVDRTRSMAILVPALAPAPGRATISFVFGHRSQRLAAINIAWVLEGEPSAAQREALLAAGTQLTSGLVGYQWDVGSFIRGHVPAPGTLIMFSGRDAQGGGAEVRLDGVALDMEQRIASAGAPARPAVKVPAPGGAARLRYSLVSQVERPDVYRLVPGSF